VGGERFRYDHRRSGGTVVVTVAGELDMAVTFRLEPELERLTDPDEVRALVLDMAAIEFMDSSGLGLLLSVHQRLQASGIRFVVADPSPVVRRMLQLTGVDGTLEISSGASNG
jgi:anti-anti-sigma factor